MSKIDMRDKKRCAVVEAIVNRQEPIHEVTRIFNLGQRNIFAGWRGFVPKAGTD